MAKGLASLLGVPHVSTGDIFRTAMADGTPPGNAIRQGMDEGPGLILDGFPRNLAQAEAFQEVLATRGRPLAAVLLLDAGDSEATGRLLSRRQCRSCGLLRGGDEGEARVPGACDACGGELYVRGDDNPESVARRLATYHAETEPLAGFYRSRRIPARAGRLGREGCRAGLRPVRVGPLGRGLDTGHDRGLYWTHGKRHRDIPRVPVRRGGNPGGLRP